MRYYRINTKQSGKSLWGRFFLMGFKGPRVRGERYGVREYWIVNPDAKYIMVYRLEGVKYGKLKYLTESDILESRALEGLKIDLSEVWAQEMKA